eukprot:CAMPEP_0176446660 /NCGR_PEP_ID=MMETSP0127-20121128/24463_1 /TAXON_ID=938130 /ORGANISM="Platyophrya macrostoma, Strain WH" /LENGTH=152 /DNA_ID=CAMNT_0017832747 /DNA_START=181 /DNA_END=639 /DNA_ORIENTATION=-
MLHDLSRHFALLDVVVSVNQDSVVEEDSNRTSQRRRQVFVKKIQAGKELEVQYCAGVESICAFNGTNKGSHNSIIEGSVEDLAFKWLVSHVSSENVVESNNDVFSKVGDLNAVLVCSEWCLELNFWDPFVSDKALVKDREDIFKAFVQLINT